jgi:hypothetical protein
LLPFSHKGIHVKSCFPKQGQEAGQTFPPGLYRPISVGVELQADISSIAGLLDGLKDPSKVDASQTGYEMVVASIFGYVLDMNMTDPGEKFLEGVTYGFPSAEKMADVEIEAYRVGAYFLDEVLELPGIF